MLDNTPSEEEWRQLFEAAQEVKALQPWRWMTEIDVFGLIDPVTDRFCMVSVMGMQGEHLSIALYLGAEAIHNILTVFQYGEDEHTHELILTAHHLQASFENRDQIDRQDYQIIKQNGLKFRGKNAWPQFRSYRPGFGPFYIDREEARLLTLALKQTVIMAKRYGENSDFFPPIDFENNNMLVRFQNEGEWQAEIRPWPKKEALSKTLEVSVDGELIQFMESLPVTPMTVEADCFIMLGMSIGERGERPIIPYTMLLVDHESGMALGTEILNPAEGLNEMWGMVPELLLASLANAGVRPQKIWTSSSLLFQFMEPFAQELGIEIEMVFELPMLGHAKSMMMHYLGGTDALM